jgi:CBS domain-containing protein
MTVSLVCNHNVATITPDQDIVEAAVRMREEHVGDLIVVNHHGNKRIPVGIITDRDIVVGIVAKRTSPDAVKVGDAMTTELLTVNRDNGVEFALREMRRVGVRRVPVVGDGGELVGVLSIDDVIDHLALQLSRIADIIRFEQEAETNARP